MWGKGESEKQTYFFEKLGNAWFSTCRCRICKKQRGSVKACAGPRKGQTAPVQGICYLSVLTPKAAKSSCFPGSRLPPPNTPAIPALYSGVGWPLINVYNTRVYDPSDFIIVGNSVELTPIHTKAKCF